jgi:hypothetical protein
VEKIKKTKTEIENNIIHNNNNKNNNNKGDKFNYYENLNLKVNGKKKLPPIKKDKENDNNKLNNNDYDIIAFNNCSECITNITSEYCRNCNKFLCLNCANENHSNDAIHKLIEIDNNEKINISRYKEELNKDLYSALNNFNNTTLDGNDNNIDIDNSQNNFEKLINMLVDSAKETKEKIYGNANYIFNANENKKNAEIKINKINEELNSIDYEKNEENNLYVIKELYLKDKTINRLKKDYECNNKDEYAKNKVENLFGEIEDEIDNVMYELEEELNIEKIVEI